MFCQLLLGALLFRAPTPATVDKLKPATAKIVDSTVERWMTNSSVPGVELAIQRNGETVYEKGYGYADVEAKTVPGPDTEFQIDSVTKCFTAMAVMRLIEMGKVKLDSPLSAYIQVPNDKWKTLTVRMLLSMTSGIPTGGTLTGTYKEVMERVAKEQTPFGVGLTFEPGTQYLYSNVGFCLLGQIIEAANGNNEDYFGFVKRVILEPLGMQNSGFLDFPKLANRATPYVEGEAVKPREPISGFAGGGMSSTMHDMERFAEAIQNRRLLSPDSYTLMWTPATLTSGSAVLWGMGWELRPVELNHFSSVIAKNGGGYGWGAQFNYYPQKGICVILLANTTGNNPTGPVLTAAKAVDRD